MRVTDEFGSARPLEQITNVADSYIDANGKPTNKIVNNEGVTGKYLSSEGKTGDDVFGKCGRWASLTGRIENENITIAILDHPKNPNYPTYWFARGYGLFAANPFGQKAYSKERNESPLKEESSFKLSLNQSVTFRYRVLIMSGVKATSKEIEKKQKESATKIK